MAFVLYSLIQHWDTFTFYNQKTNYYKSLFTQLQIKMKRQVTEATVPSILELRYALV